MIKSYFVLTDCEVIRRRHLLVATNCIITSRLISLDLTILDTQTSVALDTL